MNEYFPFSIALSWKGSAPDAQNGGAENQQSTIVFPKGNPIPSIKALTFYRSGTFSVDVQYADTCELQVPAKISAYTVGCPTIITKILYSLVPTSESPWLMYRRFALLKILTYNAICLCRLVHSNLQKVSVQS